MGIAPVYSGLEHADRPGPADLPREPSLGARHLGAHRGATGDDALRLEAKRSSGFPCSVRRWRSRGSSPSTARIARARFAASSGAAEPIRRGASVILFPEGTRSRDGRLGAIQAGRLPPGARRRCSGGPGGHLGNLSGHPAALDHRPPGPVHVTFAPPIDVAGYAGRSRRIDGEGPIRDVAAPRGPGFLIPTGTSALATVPMGPTARCDLCAS